jgi:N-dimethylarginine dimethylaminohydrolase
LCPLNEKIAIYYPYAFDPGKKLKFFGLLSEIKVARHNMSNELEMVPVSEEEAMRFACNSVVVGTTVITTYGAEQTARTLEKLGFEPKMV